MAYDGFQTKLVIAFDIGTTFSGVSCVLLIPHETPVIYDVTQWVTILVATGHLIDSFPGSLGRRSVVIPKFQVSFVMTSMEMSLLLARKQT